MNDIVDRLETATKLAAAAKRGLTQIPTMDAQALLGLLKDRVADYERWAKEIGVETCVNCCHASWNRNDGTSTCPIEHNFALVKDGYCHLFLKQEGR